MSDQIMLLSEHKLKMFGQAINPRKVLKIESTHFKHFLSIETN